MMMMSKKKKKRTSTSTLTSTSSFFLFSFFGFSLPVFLSPPPTKKKHQTHHCAPITVSIESAIRSLDCKLKLIPSVPIEMPSETPIVLKR